MTDTDSTMTRRIVFFGAAASLICAPAIVRAASLMPVRTLQFGALNPEGEFYRRCFYHSLDSDLDAGRAMSVRNNDKTFYRRSPTDGRACAGTRMAAAFQPHNLGRSSETNSRHNQRPRGETSKPIIAC
jgi:hypothetical protein